MRGVALGGFMGTGKTTVGRLLAAALGLPFVDTDALLAARHGAISAQIAEGEAAFRVREATLIAQLCDGTPRVVATGGGAWVDPVSRRVLRRDHTTVVLRARLDTLARRVGTEPGRPLWDDCVADRLAAREVAYGDADLVVDTDDLTPEQVVQAILAAREELP